MSVVRGSLPVPNLLLQSVVTVYVDLNQLPSLMRLKSVTHQHKGEASQVVDPSSDLSHSAVHYHHVCLLTSSTKHL